MFSLIKMTKLLSRVVTPFDVPTSNVWEIQFLHILCSIWHLPFLPYCNDYIFLYYTEYKQWDWTSFSCFQSWGKTLFFTFKWNIRYSFFFFFFGRFALSTQGSFPQFLIYWVFFNHEIVLNFTKYFSVLIDMIMWFSSLLGWYGRLYLLNFR